MVTEDSDRWSHLLPLAGHARLGPLGAERAESPGPLWCRQKATRWKTQEFPNRPVGTRSGDTHSPALPTTEPEGRRRVTRVRRNVLEVSDVRKAPGTVRLFPKRPARGSLPADLLRMGARASGLRAARDAARRHARHATRGRRPRARGDREGPEFLAQHGPGRSNAVAGLSIVTRGCSRKQVAAVDRGGPTGTSAAHTCLSVSCEARGCSIQTNRKCEGRRPCPPRSRERQRPPTHTAEARSLRPHLTRKTYFTSKYLRYTGKYFFETTFPTGFIKI